MRSGHQPQLGSIQGRRSVPHPRPGPPASLPGMAEDPEAAAPDVPPDTWAGVHRGPLRAGEWVRLTDQKGRRHNFELTPGKRFFSNRGHLEHDDLIGRDEGFTVTSSAGG